MKIDPLLSLAVSIHEQKGVYALLLGSGVSRSAKIPTGWEVVLDLASRVAKVSGDNTEGEEVATWYKAKFGEELNYSRLLDQLTATPAERQQVLKEYFEPTADEAEQGIKLPTSAHRAIAELVAGGYVRVILTTNFDRLIERAVSEKGIEPTVISSPDAAEGALPLAHSRCSIVKIHGDYLDTRLRNTEEELASYNKRTNKLLDRVFEEYGLIICGWSGDWDKALRTALERRKSRRFGVYWASRGEPTEQAKRLINFCGARVISIEGADSFFSDIDTKVKALEDLQIGDRLSPAVAAATVKRYLAEDRFRIRLSDLVSSALRDTLERLDAQKLELTADFTMTEFLRRLKAYETQTEVLQHMIVPLCQWGRAVHETCAVNIVELATNYSMLAIGGYTKVWGNLSLFPSVLLFYAGGLAAVSSENYSMFASLVDRPKYRDLEGEKSLCLSLSLRTIFGEVLGEARAKYKSSQGASVHLSEVLRPLFKETILDDNRFDAIFDRFEYLFTLVRADHYERTTNDKGLRGFPLHSGWFVFRNWRGTGDILSIVGQEIARMGNDWPPLKAGLFDGNVGRLKDIKTGLDRKIMERRASL